MKQYLIIRMSVGNVIHNLFWIMGLMVLLALFSSCKVDSNKSEHSEETIIESNNCEVCNPQVIKFFLHEKPLSSNEDIALLICSVKELCDWRFDSIPHTNLDEGNVTYWAIEVRELLLTTILAFPEDFISEVSTLPSYQQNNILEQIIGINHQNLLSTDLPWEMVSDKLNDCKSCDQQFAIELRRRIRWMVSQ